MCLPTVTVGRQQIQHFNHFASALNNIWACAANRARQGRNTGAFDGLRGRRPDPCPGTRETPEDTCD